MTNDRIGSVVSPLRLAHWVLWSLLCTTGSVTHSRNHGTEPFQWRIYRPIFNSECSEHNVHRNPQCIMSLCSIWKITHQCHRLRIPDSSLSCRHFEVGVPRFQAVFTLLRTLYQNWFASFEFKSAAVREKLQRWCKGWGSKWRKNEQNTYLPYTKWFMIITNA